jgi:hypothetical protein
MVEYYTSAMTDTVHCLTVFDIGLFDFSEFSCSIVLSRLNLIEYYTNFMIDIVHICIVLHYDSGVSFAPVFMWFISIEYYNSVMLDIIYCLT